MTFWQYITNPPFIKFAASVLATFLTAWIIFTQTEKKNRILAVVVLAWVGFVSYEKWIDFQQGMQRPILILYEIDQKYDSLSNPSSANFDFVFKNTGDATAYRCTVLGSFFIDDILIVDGQSDNFPEMAVGEIGKTTLILEGSNFKRVWSEESKLTAEITVSYFGAKNAEYKFQRTVLYVPSTSQKLIEPRWMQIAPKNK